MSLVYCGLSPHPPLLIPEIGRDSLERVTSTQASLQELARAIVAQRPDVVVLMSPHAPFRPDGINVLMAEQVGAAWNQCPDAYDLHCDLPLAESIMGAARQDGFATFACRSFDSPHHPFSQGLDHGTMVPLTYLAQAGLDCPMVFMSMAAWSHRRHYEFGQTLARVFEQAAGRVVFVASGDLSHRLLPGAPAGYEPRGANFDQRVVADVAQLDATDLLALDDGLIDCAGECGLRTVATMLGLVAGRSAQGRVLSYEGPFGVGYCVAAIEPGAWLRAVAGEGDPSRDAVADAAPVSDATPGASDCATVLDTADPDLFLSAARTAVETWVREHKPAAIPNVLPASLAVNAAAFVCLKIDGRLRGCIGTTVPTQPSLAAELVHNAIAACSRDPRFPPVKPEELSSLHYAVDVLTKPEPAASLRDLDPAVYGVIVRRGARCGVLLPNLEGVDTVEMQVDIARQKAGIGPFEDVELQRFRVHRYEQKD